MCSRWPYVLHLVHLLSASIVPQCATSRPSCWLALQRARLLACDHYHVIFTLPHELNPLWLANVPLMTTLLFQAVRDTLYLIGRPQVSRGAAGHPRRAPHPESDVGLHPHVHCLVTGWADPSGAVGRGAPGISPPGPRGDGRLSGEDGGHSGRRWRVGRWPCPSR